MEICDHQFRCKLVLLQALKFTPQFGPKRYILVFFILSCMFCSFFIIPFSCGLCYYAFIVIMIKRTTHSVCLLVKVEKKVQAICLRNVSSNVEHNNVSEIIWDRSLLGPQQKWGYNVHRSLVLSIYNFASTQEDTLHSIRLPEWNKHTYGLFNFAIFLPSWEESHFLGSYM